MFNEPLSENAVLVISAVVGALVGALASILFNWMQPLLRQSGITKKLKMTGCKRVGTSGTVLVANKSIYPIRDAWAYLTLKDMDESNDIIDPPEGKDAFISSKHPMRVEDHLVCWAFNMPGKVNPPNRDIYPGEKQRLSIVNAPDSKEWIEISSEQGFSTRTLEGERLLKSRVFLKKRQYRGIITIVSQDTKAKKFEIVIYPEDHQNYLIRVVRKLLIFRWLSLC